MRTLRQRLLTILLAWLALVLALFSTVVFLQVRQALRGDVDQFVRDKAFILGYQVNPWYPAGMFYDEKPWRSDRYTGYGQTFDTNWNLLFKSTRLSEPIAPTDELKRFASHPLGVVHHDAMGPDGVRYRMATVRMERQGKIIFYAQFGVRSSERDAPLRRLVFWLAGCSAIALLLAWLGLDYVIRQWGAPLAALSETARKVNLGNLSHQRLFAPPDAPELAQLATTFNELLDRVEAAHTSQHRFVADASHELRTPLTILRGEIDVALRRPRSPDEYAEVLQSSREEIERLSRLTDNLLTLARADAGDPLVRRDPVDVSAVAREVCRKLAPLSEQRKVPLACEAPGPAVVSGDAVALEQMILNLAENALRYTPPGEGATVRVVAHDSEVSLEVADHGSGIAAEHLPHLFDRFYRVDKARSREFGGAGLGLSIVKTLAEAHGGQVEVRSQVGQGSIFTVQATEVNRSCPLAKAFTSVQTAAEHERGPGELREKSLPGGRELQCNQEANRYNVFVTETIRTTCTMDCPDSCALEVVVAEGRIARIQAAPVEKSAHPNTQGFICDKVGKFDKRVYHDSRVLYPQRRIGPKGQARFERISWDRAISIIVERFRAIIARWGAEAILPYHYDGSNGLLSHDFLDAYFFAKLGASRLARTLCAAPASAVATGMYGKMPGVAFEDYPKARAILVWGANPKYSNIHLVPYLRQARKNGAFVAMIDPVRNFSPGEIDLHLPVYPTADLPVALAMIRHWHRAGRLDRSFLSQHADGLEPLLAAAQDWPIARAAAEARVPADDIEKLARVFAAASPALIRVGWGIERNRNGGQALAAVMAIPALLGKFGIRGGGYTLSNSGAAKLDMATLFGADSPPARWNTRELNMSQLGRLLTDHLAPPVQSLFIYDCNPAATAPDQNAILRGLARDDLFTVVHEQVMTDTARYADILLPAATFLEQHEIKRSYGSYIVGGVQPAIEACGEARPNEWVFAQLGRAMGFSDEPFGWDSATSMNKVVGALSLAGRPCDPSPALRGDVQGYPFPGGGPVQFEDVKPLTPDGKVHLTPSALGPAPFQYQPVNQNGFPLALVSASNNKMISSTLGEFNYPELWLALSPADAAARGISDRDEVRIFNDLGEVCCRAQINDQMRDGVCGLPKGAWRKSSRNGQTSTALCSQHVNEVGGGACFNDARVEVERVLWPVA